MSATTRSIQATPSFGPLVAAFAAILVAVGLALALAYSQLGALQVTTAPVSGSAQNMHDHGLSTAAGAAPRNVAAQYAHDHGSLSAAPFTTVGWTTPPYTSSAPASTLTGAGPSGANGTRFAR
jgi:hypothetical protein